MDDDPVAGDVDNTPRLFLVNLHDPGALEKGSGCDPLVGLDGSHDVTDNRVVSAVLCNSILASLVPVVPSLPSGDA